MPQYFSDPESLVATVAGRQGARIVLALPLGLGKANHIANEFCALAAQRPELHLNIFTALTLEKPRYANELERRFLSPVIERLFGAYPDLAYAKALRAGTMPSNIEVNEFFFLAGQWLGNPRAQQSYISANYTHAGRYVMERGVNVIAQLVARRGERFSLSCNTDITLDLLKARREGRVNFHLAGQVNSELPFMPGEAEIGAEEFDAILDAPAFDFPLFAPPKEPIDLAEYAAGIHAARLVRDGGTLQIGIGQEGDAAAHALILRQGENAAFREAVARLSPDEANAAFLEQTPFAEGLYAATEMLVDSFLALMDASILKREVDGALLHAAFFVGPKEFYRRLREMPATQLEKLRMTAVSFTNQLYGDEEAKRAARKHARFVNSAMMATLMGAVISDGLEDGRVVSGVGGQYNFVEQAFALPDARSIITVDATRTAHGKTTSNIRWSYGHETIPRHLRDVIVTEYGVADLRGKSDAEVIAAMLAIADSRFQPELMRAAKDAGKLPRRYEIPATRRDNTPVKIEKALAPLRARGLLPEFPFGTDFTPVEQRLLPALNLLRSSSSIDMARLALAGLASKAPPGAQACLERMGLASPSGMADRIYRLLLRAALAQTENRQ
ncbi:MAG TPA: acetyl-CoA hydrolase/transferase C-terminal domain-containing protein [Rhizomicrobium sp.]|nr:acetyl-CoA hydrolase/transferase C-terminal domain-containing protein [Rhizomicrobium sp.]